MWESCLYGSVRGRKTTVVWKRCCGTVAKAGGNRENKHLPVALGGSCLLESWRLHGIMAGGSMYEFTGQEEKISINDHGKISLQGGFLCLNGLEMWKKDVFAERIWNQGWRDILI